MNGEACENRRKSKSKCLGAPRHEPRVSSTQGAALLSPSRGGRRCIGHPGYPGRSSSSAETRVEPRAPSRITARVSTHANLLRCGRFRTAESPLRAQSGGIAIQQRWDSLLNDRDPRSIAITCEKATMSAEAAAAPSPAPAPAAAPAAPVEEEWKTVGSKPQEREHQRGHRGGRGGFRGGRGGAREGRPGPGGERSERRAAPAEGDSKDRSVPRRRAPRPAEEAVAAAGAAPAEEAAAASSAPAATAAPAAEAKKEEAAAAPSSKFNFKAALLAAKAAPAPAPAKPAASEKKAAAEATAGACAGPHVRGCGGCRNGAGLIALAEGWQSLATHAARWHLVLALHPPAWATLRWSMELLRLLPAWPPSAGALT
jgi:hypothetical protein